MKFVYLFNVDGTNVYKIGNSKHPGIKRDDLFYFSDTCMLDRNFIEWSRITHWMDQPNNPNK